MQKTSKISPIPGKPSTDPHKQKILFPPPPNSISISQVQARSVKIEWTHSLLKRPALVSPPPPSNTNTPTDGKKQEQPAQHQPPHVDKVVYQVSKSEGKSGVYKHVYEGEEVSCIVGGLIPLTHYTIKVRTRFASGNEDVWSLEYVSVEVDTVDESEISTANIEIIRAIKDNKISTLQTVISKVGKEIDFNSRDKSGLSFLMIACQSGSKDIVNLLLKSGASPTITTKSGKSPLSMAMTYGNVGAVETLVIFPGIDINQCDHGGSTPLMWAVENASINKFGLEILQLLLANGANVNAVDSQGRSAMERLLTTNGNVKAAHLLLKHNCALINKVSTAQPLTSFMMAAMNGHKDICKLLLNHYQADPDVKTVHGATASMLAQGAGHFGVVEAIGRWKKNNAN